MTDQFVYFIEAENGLVKIGNSTNIHKRLTTLKTQSPIKLKLIHSIPCKEFSGTRIERDLHIYFSKQRSHGEWFKLSKAAKRQIQHFDEHDVRQLVILLEPQTNLPRKPIGGLPDFEKDWLHIKRK